MTMDYYAEMAKALGVVKRAQELMAQDKAAESPPMPADTPNPLPCGCAIKAARP